MKKLLKLFGALTLGGLLTLFLGFPALHAAGDERPAVAPAEVLDEEPGLGLDSRPSEAPPWEGPVSRATPATTLDETFFVCVSSDFLCGGCPSGTICASEATSDLGGLCCTANFRCVTSCSLGGCQGLCVRLPG